MQEQLGADRAWAVDLLAACTGLLYELSIADAMVATGRAGCLFVIGAEVLSPILDWSDRSTSVLLGDGAAAAIVKPASTGGGYRSWCLGSDGHACDLLTFGEHGPARRWLDGTVILAKPFGCGSCAGTWTSV